MSYDRCMDIDLEANGWTQTRSGKWKHPQLLPSEHGRVRPVGYREAERIEKRRLAQIEAEKPIDPMKRLVSLAILGSMFRDR